MPGTVRTQKGMSTLKNPKRVDAGVPTGGQFAATAHSDNVPSLTPQAQAAPVPEAPSATAPKTSSRGRTTYVTLPDGTVATRSSKTKTYTHAVVQSPEIPELVIADREAQIKKAKADIAAREAALKDPTFKKRRRFPSDRDPDTDYQGRPTYNGFEYFLMSADGEKQLETTWGNSTGDTRGCYDPETLEYDYQAIGRAVPELKLQTKNKIERLKDTIKKCEEDIEKVNNGTYNLGSYGVVSWASRPDLAHKAANTYARHTRRTTVSPIDQ